ncbi:hypothetical protein DH86_00000006, partial [Scytalidium sp. 3C]
TLQRDDGSFGELVYDGVIEGGRDMRHCYLAAAIRWILNGDAKENEAFDFDIEKLVDHVRSGQAYDGGISESSEQESNAGYAYCAIGALSLLGRLLDPSSVNAKNSEATSVLTNMQGTIHWLASRQVEYVESDHDEGSNGTDDLYVGFNGRWNKLADTCYSFWVTASLD